MTTKLIHLQTLLDKAMDIIASDSHGEGVCAACGATGRHLFYVEPDARKYECDTCGEHTVYGAEEIVLLYGW
jgi:predicted RNA-binding Zn-ribbon protein involved in translation (DUF1610 family)